MILIENLSFIKVCKYKPNAVNERNLVVDGISQFLTENKDCDWLLSYSETYTTESQYQL